MRVLYSIYFFSLIEVVLNRSDCQSWRRKRKNPPSMGSRGQTISLLSPTLDSSCPSDFTYVSTILLLPSFITRGSFSHHIEAIVTL
jgi:hypothetical protein